MDHKPTNSRDRAIVRLRFAQKRKDRGHDRLGTKRAERQHDEKAKKGQLKELKENLRCGSS